VAYVYNDFFFFRATVLEVISFIVRTISILGLSTLTGSIFKSTGRLPDLNSNLIYKLFRALLRMVLVEFILSNIFLS
jgi:hypothetical protein